MPRLTRRSAAQEAGDLDAAFAGAAQEAPAEPEQRAEEAPPEPGQGLIGTPLAEGDVADVAITSYATRDFYSAELTDEGKGRKGLIKDVVKLCRGSPEYRRYTQYLRENLNMGSCSVLSGLAEEEHHAAGIELHHHPLTLYDICEVVMMAMENSEARFSLFSVAHRVMEIHYENRIGLVPLTITMHQMAHDGQLRIDPRSIFGDWISFLREYGDYLSEDTEAKVRSHLGGWTDGGSANQNTHSLRLNPLKWVAEHPTLQGLMARSDQLAAPAGPTDEEISDAID